MIFARNAASEKQKNTFYIFFGRTVSVKFFFGAGDPNFQQSADCRKFGSLDCMVVVNGVDIFFL